MKRLYLALLAALLMQGAAAQDPIDIVFNGATAEVTVPTGITGVMKVVDGANVVIISTNTATEYTYRVSGYSADGSLTINGSYKLTLQLDGLTLTNAHSGPAIDIECGKRIDVVLGEGTVNTLEDSPGGHKGAFYIKGHAEFKGAGTLNVTGHAKHAICVKEYVELKKSLGTINVLGAVSDGIHCGKGEADPEKNYFQMNGGTLNISGVGSDGVDTDDYGTVRIKGGAVSVNTGDYATSLKADSIVSVSGGLVNLNVTGEDSEGIRARWAVDISGGQVIATVSGNGSKGIKGKKMTDASAYVKNGGNVSISGGNVTIFVTGGDLADALGDVSHCMGINVDGDLTQTGGDVTITATGKDAYTSHVKGVTTTSGGTFGEARTPWTVGTTYDTLDMTVFAAVQKGGSSLMFYGGLAVGAFIDGKCVGTGVFEIIEHVNENVSEINTDYGMIRIFAPEAKQQGVTFKLYDYQTDEEYELTSASAVTFEPGTTVGTPSEPLILSWQEKETVGIAHTSSRTEKASATPYDLSGRPAPDNGRKGIYVVRGRKISR